MNTIEPETTTSKRKLPLIIIVAASQRSGTNLVCNSIGHLDEAINLGEIFQVNFGNKAQIPQTNRWRQPILNDLFGMERFPHYIMAPIRSWPKMAGATACTKLLKAVASGAYSEDINTAFNKNNANIFICKITFQQCPTHFSTWDMIEKYNNIRIIYLKRPNPIEILVSSVNAHQQKQWYISANQTEQPRFDNVHIKPSHMLDFITFVEHQFTYFDVWFSKLQDKVLNITYDDLCDRWDSTITKILDFIEVPDQKVEPASKRQITIPRHADLIENIDEIREYFKGTKWESLLM